MSYIELQHSLARILIVIGTLFSGAGILGNRRLKWLGSRNRRFRRQIKIHLLMRATKKMFGVFFVLLSLCSPIVFVVMPFFIPLSSSPPIPDGVERVYFYLFLLFSMSLSMIGVLGISFISIKLIVKVEYIEIVEGKLITAVDKYWRNSWFWNKVRTSFVYRLLYNLLFPPVFATTILPLRSIYFLLAGGTLGGAYRMSLTSYSQNFSDFYLRSFFTPVVIIFYFYWFYVGYSLFALMYGLMFIYQYLVLWLIINLYTIILSFSLYLLLLPYLIFETLRIKWKLRESVLVAGILFNILGALLD